MSEYIFVTNIFEYSNIRIYSSHSGLEAEFDLCHAVFAVLLDLAVVEEDAIVVEGVAVWAEVGDELAVGGVRAQCFALSKTHSSNGVNDVVFVSLTSLILNRAHPR